MNQKKPAQARKSRVAAAIETTVPSRVTAPIPSFDSLPDGAYVRAADLVRDPKRPTRPTPLPMSAATLWRRVRAGNFVQPTRLGERITCWKVGDIRQWLAAQQEGGAQ